MVWSVSSITEVVATREVAVLCQLDQIEDAWSDELHRAGEHTRSSFRQGQILIGVNADGIFAGLGGGCDRTVAGDTTTTEDRISTLIHHGLGGLCAPFRI